MTETRWQIIDPQNRIRRLAPVSDGTVTVQIVLPGDDAATVQAVEDAAAAAGIELERVVVEEPKVTMLMPQPSPPALPTTVVIDGFTYALVAPVLPS